MTGFSSQLVCILPLSGQFKDMSPLRLSIICLVGVSSWVGLHAAEVGEARAIQAEPRVLGPSDGGLNAIPTFAVADGLKVDLVAAEPLLANPVAFAIDEQGVFYVAETFRHGQGVLDIRGRAGWPSAAFKSRLSPERLANLSEELLDVDLAVRTVEDRVAYLKQYMGDEIGNMTVASDRVRRLEDLDGDGVMDEATVFADDFRTIADGIGAGLLARKGDVYFANIPNMWRLSDYDRDGKPERRESLHYGYGVRTGFLGHDLHGLVMGPDGKLYFSIGDRGAHVETFDGRLISIPDTGAVFRCYPDGSQLEIYATGLRNPQELAFDAYGNLFTGDNNSDGGDEARWVYLVEGGDSGWRIGYQFIQRPNARGPWNSEKLWHPRFDGQAAYIIPPLANIGNGPSGLAYYPGVGLSEAYQGAFLMVDFKGSKQRSGIHRIQVKADGAGYAVDQVSDLIWQTAATDVAFGYDGSIYFTDWVSGWATPGKGRIYRISDPEIQRQGVVRELKETMRAGLEGRTAEDLVGLLAFPDMRVRQEAQFELATRGLDSLPVLASVLKSDAGLFPRLHAIWGIGQVIDRAGAGTDQHVMAARVEALAGSLHDPEAEVRAQICKVLGELKVSSAFSSLVRALSDPAPRVRYYAALALGKLAHPEAVPALLRLAEQNADKDVYVRHAVVMALVGINDLPAILEASESDDTAVARVSLLALRRLKRDEISRFLKHPDPELVREAALAINDVPIESATVELAAVLSQEGLGEPVVRRALNANYRLGTYDSAAALVAFATRTGVQDSWRREALEMLAEWEGPLGRDRVTGNWRPLINRGRDSDIAAQAAAGAIEGLLIDDFEGVQRAALDVVAALDLRSAAVAVSHLMIDSEEESAVRVAALETYQKVDPDQFEQAVKAARDMDDEDLRSRALELSTALDGTDSFDVLQDRLESGSIREQQGALNALATLSGSRVETLLGQWMDRLEDQEVPSELLLELEAAVAAQTESELVGRWAAYRESLPNEESARRHPELLVGGDADAGRTVFFEKLEVSCLRCHKISGEGGDAGPDLTQVAARQDRTYLLESILYPNAAIAEGFETVMLDLGDGIVIGGIIQEENEEQITILNAEDGEIELSVDEVKGRSKGASSMPPYLKDLLTSTEIRDLVAYLSTLK